MSEVTRRDWLTALGAAMLSGGISAEAAQHVHQAVAEAKKPAAGAYKPKVFTAHEYKTLQVLADLIIPADEVSKGAVEAGAPEFIDLLCSGNSQLALIYTGGLGWLDRESRKRFGSVFIEAKPEQQRALLDLLAYSRNAKPELAPGIHFFNWARRMVVDAFYTSPIGIADVGYKGNKGMAKFEVPVEAIQYALKRSGLG
ncbi:MAG: gluconate 2-dehydrogenase subunit 3 family protein [Bryobacteraceae bacterium]|nr:gluconate 2-dehydrogenase subunit 3 family protein [Bryobacteraceae bacterium]